MTAPLTITPAIEKRLRNAASRFGSEDGTADDLYQEMVISCLERERSDPAFAGQKPAYVAQHGIWHARHVAREERTYEKYVTTPVKFTQSFDPIQWSNEELDFEIYCFEDALVDHTLSPEDALIQAEAERDILDVIESLSPENKKIVTMLFVGYRESDVAETLHISRSAVSQRKTVIKKVLSTISISL